MPRRLPRDVPMETIYEQIAHVRSSPTKPTRSRRCLRQARRGDRGAGRRVVDGRGSVAKW
jgi:hypothetical protein